MPTSETVIQMIERHLREGGGRIARQEELIVRLETNGHHNMASRAWEMLDCMHAAQHLGRQHLNFELAKAHPWSGSRPA